MLDESAQATVIDGLRTGDRTAWSALYEGYSADIWRYVARLVGPEKTVAADVVQETFLAAARTARQFDRARGTLWNWLTGIAHHQIAAHWRQAGRQQRLQALLESQAPVLSRWLAVTEAAEESWARQELADAVRNVLADLPSDYTALLTGKYLDDRSLDELASDLGGTVEAIKSRLARARREFRTQMERWLRRETATAREPRKRTPESVSETGRP